ncbi:MAG: hypothetical protein GF365_00665 [Candidatus Buchananbacteria bacterium]|nr:hypothetical protein [Candidatus Buchananbacteria bacterium]
MSRIFKICFIIALFIFSGSVAWAAFNYDSANNYFLIDSILKTGGDYVLIGEGLSGYCENDNYISQAQCEANNSTWYEVLSKIAADGTETESTSFFAVSNNLIFPANARFISGVRSMNIDEFSTNAISVNSSNNFTIRTPGSSGTLSFFAGVIEMQQKFRIKNGLSFRSGITANNFEIHVPKVLTEKIELLDSAEDKLTITSDGLYLTAGGTATAADIYFGTADSNLCKVKSINTAGTGHYTENDQIGDFNLTQTDCDSGYYIYDISADTSNYKMVCCRIDNCPGGGGNCF